MKETPSSLLTIHTHDDKVLTVRGRYTISALGIAVTKNDGSQVVVPATNLSYYEIEA